MGVVTHTKADVGRRVTELVAQGQTAQAAAKQTAREFQVGYSTAVDNYRLYREGKLAEPPKPAVATPFASPDTPDLATRILPLIRKSSHTTENLANTLDVSPRRITEAVEALRAQGVIVDDFGGALQIGRDMQPTAEPHTINLSAHREQVIPFGAVADTHLGSNYERLDVLEALYDRFAAAGVETVFHGGNWIDGEARFNKHDIYVHGYEAQLANFVRKYPQRKGITTQIVSGDDHEGWYVQSGGHNPGKRMVQTAAEAGRTDLVDLGYMERDIELVQAGGSATLRVIHAGGGSAYATSYTAQKYAESLQGGEKPNIVLMGHYHKFEYGFPREVHIIQPGCTQDQTPFERKKKIQAHVGGCILWIRQNEIGVVTSLKVEWIPFFDRKFYAYKGSAAA